MYEIPDSVRRRKSIFFVFFRNEETQDAKPQQVVLLEGMHNGGFGTGESTGYDYSANAAGPSVSKYFHNTYHGQAHRHRPALTFGIGDRCDNLDQPRPIQFRDISPNYTEPSQSTDMPTASSQFSLQQVHFQQQYIQHPQGGSNTPSHSASTAGHGPSIQSPGSNDSEVS